MRVGLWFFGLVLISISLLRCTKAPETPRFTGSSPEVESILLDEELRAKDLKRIFKALNKNGRLDAFKPLIEEPTQDELEQISSFLSRHVYKTAYHTDSLGKLIERRSYNKGFTDWEKKLKKWTRNAPELLPLTHLIFTHPELSQILHRDIQILNPSLHQTFVDIHLAKSYQPQYSKLPEQKTIPAESWLSDLYQLIHRKEVRSELTKVAKQWQEKEMGRPVFRTLNSLELKFQSRAFEGIATGFARMNSTRPEESTEYPHSYLGRLFKTAEVTNQNSFQLFYTLQERLKKDTEFTDKLLEETDSLVTKGISGWIREHLEELPLGFWKRLSQPSDKNRPEFFVLYEEVLKSIENITGRSQERSHNGEDHFLAELPARLNAYALSKWLETLAIANKERLEKLPDHVSLIKIWADVFSSPDLVIEIADDKAQTEFLSLSQNGKLPTDFSVQLKKLIDSKVLKNTRYDFTAYKNNFPKVLHSAVAHCQEVRPFASSELIWRTLLYEVTRPKDASLFTLSDLDGPNLLAPINRFFTSQSLKTIRKFKRLFFEDLNIDDASIEFKDLLSQLFENNPKAKVIVDGVLQNISSLREIDETIHPNLPTPFVSYRELLMQVPSADIELIGNALGLFSKANIFALEPDSEDIFTWYANYPGINQWILQTRGLAQFFSDLNVLGRQNQYSFLNFLERSLGEPIQLNLTNNGIDQHLSFLDSLVSTHSSGMVRVIHEIQSQGLSWLPGFETLSIAERKWIISVVEDPDFIPVWRILDKYCDLPRLIELTQEIIKLDKNGHLIQTIELLEFLSNERVQRIAKSMRIWSESGELMIFAHALESFLQQVSNATQYSGPFKPQNIVVDVSDF